LPTMTPNVMERGSFLPYESDCNRVLYPSGGVRDRAATEWGGWFSRRLREEFWPPMNADGRR
jgi:hypothetical protein